MTKIFSAWSLGLWPSSLLVEFFEPSSSGFGRFQQRQRPLLDPQAFPETVLETIVKIIITLENFELSIIQHGSAWFSAWFSPALDDDGPNTWNMTSPDVFSEPRKLQRTVPIAHSAQAWRSKSRSGVVAQPQLTTHCLRENFPSHPTCKGHDQIRLKYGIKKVNLSLSNTCRIEIIEITSQYLAIQCIHFQASPL